MLINNIKARKILSKGCIAFLAHIINKTNKTVSDVKDTLVLQEFPNVFPNSLPRLALENKVEFSIELASCTMPISKEPYKIALAKKHDLKK